MSEDVYEGDRLAISTYAGPGGAGGRAPTGRKRVQLLADDVNGRPAWITLSMDQWAELRRAVDRLGDDCRPPEHDEGTSYCTSLPEHQPGEMGCKP